MCKLMQRYRSAFWCVYGSVVWNVTYSIVFVCNNVNRKKYIYIFTELLLLGQCFLLYLKKKKKFPTKELPYKGFINMWTNLSEV